MSQLICDVNIVWFSGPFFLGFLGFSIIYLFFLSDSHLTELFKYLCTHHCIPVYTDNVDCQMCTGVCTSDWQCVTLHTGCQHISADRHATKYQLSTYSGPS